MLRRFHIVLITLVGGLSLALSCHGAEGAQVESSAPAAVPSDAGPGIFLLSREEQGLPAELSPLNQSLKGDLDQMLARRFIRVLTVFQPGWLGTPITNRLLTMPFGRPRSRWHTSESTSTCFRLEWAPVTPGPRWKWLPHPATTRTSRDQAGWPLALPV